MFLVVVVVVAARVWIVVVQVEVDERPRPTLAIENTAREGSCRRRRQESLISSSASSSRDDASSVRPGAIQRAEEGDNIRDGRGGGDREEVVIIIEGLELRGDHHHGIPTVLAVVVRGRGRGSSSSSSQYEPTRRPSSSSSFGEKGKLVY